MNFMTGLKARQPTRNLAAGRAALHLTFGHARIEHDPLDVVDVFKRPSSIADLKPTGRYVAKDLSEAGTVPLLMKIPPDHGLLQGACTTVACANTAVDPKGMERGRDEDVTRMAFQPQYCAGQAAGRKSLAVEDALVKVVGMSELKFSDRARCFDPEKVCFDAVAVRRLKLFPTELDQRRKGWKPRAPEFNPECKSKYAQRAGAARGGAVIHPATAAEKACYADV